MKLELDPLAPPVRTTEVKTVWTMRCDTPGCDSTAHDELPNGSIECRKCHTRRRNPDPPETTCP